MALGTWTIPAMAGRIVGNEQNRAGRPAAIRGAGEPEAESDYTFVDGHRMHSLRVRAWDENGEPRPELILLHGILGAAACWRRAMRGLSELSTVIAVDALGVGASERVPGLDGSLPASADRLARFMDEEGIERADIAGTSHGGAVAMTFAARHPDRVRSLVLHAPANPFCRRSLPSIRFYTTPFGQWFAHQAPAMPRAVQTLALERMYGDPKQVQAGALENYLDSLRVPGTTEYILSVLANWFADMAELKRLLPRLRSLPVRLLWGTHDRAVSVESGERLAKAIGAEFVVMPGAGHVPYEEAPEVYAELVNEFLAGQDRTRSAGLPVGQAHLRAASACSLS